MRFSPIQQQAINIRDKNVLVFASAGSGKTSVLVERLCQLVLKDHISIESILAMTFTNDAANEMKTRLKISLEKAPFSPYIQEQLALLETASICTIDSFCLSVVKNYYYRIPISYKMAQTIEPSSQKQIFQEAYQEACAQIDPQLMADLNVYFSCFGKGEEDRLKALETLIQTAWSKPNPEQWIQESLNGTHPEIDAWFFRYFEQSTQSILEILQRLRKSIDISEIDSRIDALQPCLQAIRNKDYTTYRKAFLIYVTGQPRLKNKYDDTDIKSDNEALRKREKKILDVLFDKEVLNGNDSKSQQRIHTFCDLALKTQALYAQKKKEQEIMDFGDIEHFAYELLSQKDIAEEVRSKYQMILVDEFQDTNDLQESILACFCRPNNVFRVGDIKQSIYGFRHAKPQIMKAHMENQDENSCTLILDENYRSNESIIAFNNDFYQKIMNVQGMPPQFDQKDIARAGTASQQECTQYPVRFLFSEYTPYAKQEDISVTQSRSLWNENRWDQLAKDILKHKEQGTPFKDMCILTRNHGPQEKIKKVLELYDIPVLAEIDHGFYTNASIQIVLSCLQAILDPYDDLALCAVLLSPLCDVTPDELAQACLHKEKGQSLYSNIRQEKWMESFKILRSWRHEPIGNLIRHIYAHHDFYQAHTTEQDKVNLDMFLQLASQTNDPYDVEGFIRQQTQATQFDALGEAYPYGKEADVVSIKTMHHSKGLQFPVVYIVSQHEARDRVSNEPVLIDEKLGLGLMGTDDSMRIKLPSKHHLAIRTKKLQDELEEEMRVFYVATTRAQKELILIDTISCIEDYSLPLSLSSLMKNQSYTGWIFQTYYHSQSPLIRFERQNQLIERPDVQSHKNVEVPKLLYQKPIVPYHSMTASMSKPSKGWPDLNLESKSAMDRGTLFHEMVAQLSYPYQKDDMYSYAHKRGYELTDYDLHCLQALNENKMYQSYMNHHHRFECPYIVQDEQSLWHGFMDLVIWLEDRIVIVDFKTDRIDSLSELTEKYHDQLEAYRKAMEKMESLPIETYLYSFSKHQFIQST